MYQDPTTSIAILEMDTSITHGLLPEFLLQWLCLLPICEYVLHLLCGLDLVLYDSKFFVEASSWLSLGCVPAC